MQRSRRALLRLLEIVEILALEVFFEGVLAGGLIDDIHDAAGQDRQPRLLGRLPAGAHQLPTEGGNRGIGLRASACPRVDICLII